MRSFLFKRHLIMTTLIFFALAINAQELDSRLKPLEPLLKSKWEGFLKSPDGKQEFLVIRTFEVLQKGKIIKCTKTNEDRGNYGEGFFYWDDQNEEIAFFFIENNGVFNRGFVETDNNLIKIEGTMTWPRQPNPQVSQTFNFRNTFEVNENGSFTDRWFQDAFGDWRPGHVITFHSESYNIERNKDKIVAFSDELWDLKGARVGKHLGREALMGTAFLKNTVFSEGTISVDIATAGRSRSYPGVLFHVQGRSNYERVYIRPHRSPFYTDALQYAPSFNGVDSWQLYNGPGKTAGIDILPDQWNRLTIVVKNENAYVFWNKNKKPSLVIAGLELGDVKGTLGLNGPVDGSAWYSNFSYSPEINYELPPAESIIPLPGTINDWKISEPFALQYADFSAYPAEINNNSWKEVEADESGIVDISRYYGRSYRAGDVIIAKTKMLSRKDTLMRFGLAYSDFVTVYLNGQPVYFGNSAYQSRDRSFLGIVGYFDNLFLPLKAGENEILLQLGEASGGWAFGLRKEDEVYMAEDLKKSWECTDGMALPEACVYDTKNEVIYVSNYFNEGREYISRLSLDGKVLDEKWITGLRMPTGMAIHDNLLYAIDRTGINIIDIQKREIIEKTPLPGLLAPNDIAIDVKGNVYISDLPANKVFRLVKDKPECFLEGLNGPNALVVHNNKLLVGQNESLVEVDLSTAESKVILVFEAGSNIDGIVPLGEAYLVVDHYGKLYRVGKDGTKELLLNTSNRGIQLADFCIIPEKKQIIIPAFNENSLTSYSLNDE